ncbi:D-ribose-binding periplasmic protein precursor [Stieleria neptunia]|uniref:D-ribose-binding periplasmic protein n=1 Tax=Stieleria neptunia TaxID=2527979 RepID=A0A518HR25_9BACT|nr:sugar ABC transporter substrate-binding protein [Stieleria neptunia]QDV43312.1 D-ribose-binding periplasmic protein precursor [Stieleria neptunia]
MRHFLFPILFAVAVSGCSSKSDTSTAQSNSDATDDRPKVALMMKSLANEFFSTMAEGAKTHQSQHADEYELIVNGIKDERDLSRQVALVDEMVAAGADAIVIAPADSKALVPSLRKAINKGVVVINIDNQLDAEVLASEGVTVPFVGPDNQAGAKQVGDYLAEKLTAGDKVAILEGIRTSFNSQQRVAGFEASMKAAGVEIVSSQSAEWEMAKANSIAASILSEHPDIKAILAANDSMALGAIAAVKSAGKTGDVLVVGFDNISAVQQAIRDGKILATADQYGDKLAVFGIETALQLINGETDKPSDVETPVDLVTAESL